MSAAQLEAVALQQEAEDEEFAGLSPFDAGHLDTQTLERFRQWWTDRATILVGDPLEEDDVSDPFPPYGE